MKHRCGLPAGGWFCTRCGIIRTDLRPDWRPHVNKQRVWAQDRTSNTKTTEDQSNTSPSQSSAQIAPATAPEQLNQPQQQPTQPPQQQPNQPEQRQVQLNEEKSQPGSNQQASKAVRIAVLVNPTNDAETTLREVQEAAHTLGLQIQVLNARTVGEIDAAFATLAHERPDALFVAGDAFFLDRRVQFATLTARDRDPTLRTSFIPSVSIPVVRVSFSRSDRLVV